MWVGWVMGITPVRHARSCSLSLSLSSKPPGERQRVSRRKEGPEACSGTLTPKRAAEGLGPRLAPTGRPVLSLATPLRLERLNIYLPFLL